MNPTRFRRLARLFLDAADRDETERDAWLAAACSDDPDLEREVRALLERDALPGKTWTGVALGGATLDDHREDPIAPGTRIGPFTLEERIGEGGMGVVYRAEQEGPIRREVAIKWIKRGVLTAETAARFEMECRSLARMRHANVANVLDVGASEDGRPYLVMEYVPGRPITSYCDERCATIEERLRVFSEVCHGVQHAHRNAVIHRDLKPSNVLVRDDGVPKIIDFGVAKTERTDDDTPGPRTATWQILGTPAYMSPEQLVLGPSRIDTRSDVYALGVMLHELLTGSLPFARESDRSHYDACRERIEQVGAPVSSVAANVGENAARRRGSTPSSLSRRLRGDLDGIVAMALRAEPELRYRSAEELAADIDRHLAGKPVHARPNTVGYRVARFVRRNRASVILASLLAVVVLGSGLTAAVQALRIATARERATQEARLAKDTSDFLLGFLGTPRSLFDRLSPPARTSGEAVDFAADRALLELGDRPETQVRLLLTVAEILAGDRRLEQALDLTRRAREIADTAFGAEHATTIDATEHLGDLLFRYRALDEAAPLLESVVAVRGRAADGDATERTRSAVNLAALYRESGRTREATAILERLLHDSPSPPSRVSPASLAARDLLSAMYLDAGRYRDALPHLEELRDVLPDVHGPDVRGMTYVTYNLACAHANLGNVDVAMRYLDDAVERGFSFFGNLYADDLLREIHGAPGFAELARASTLNGFAHGFAETTLQLTRRLARGELDRTEAGVREALAAIERTEGTRRHAKAYQVQRILALVQLRQGRYDEAEATLAELRALIRANPALDDSLILTELPEFEVQIAIGKGDRARALARIRAAVEDPNGSRLTSRVAYFSAVRAMLEGRRGDALEALERSARTGYHDETWIRHDIAFRNLRQDPRFEAIVTRIDGNGL